MTAEPLPVSPQLAPMPDRDSSPAGRLASGCAALGLALSEATQQRLLAYLDLLLDWNRHYNLTAIRDRTQAVHRHLLDALALVPVLGPGLLVDVGSGGGIPGLVLAIADPARPVVLVDSVGKKARFLEHARRQLGLDQVSVRKARVESLQPSLRAPWVVSRAFAELPKFAALAGGLVQSGGRLMAMKGHVPEAEIAALPAPWRVLRVHPLRVPGLEAERCLVEIAREGEP